MTGRDKVRVMGRVVAVGLLAGLLLTTGQAEGVGAQANPDALRVLALRFLAPPVSGPNGMTQTAELLPGAVPGDVPLMIPAPPGTNLIGSMVRKFAGASVSWEIAFDSPSSQDDLLNFYTQALAPQGFVPPPVRTGGGRGFAPVSGNAAGAPRGSFCRSANGPYVAVSAAPTGGGATDLRLFVVGEASGFCGGAMPTVGGPVDRVPALAAPAGVAIANPTGTIGPNRAVVEAIATAAATAADLDAAYGAQLVAAGWTKTGGNANGPVAWSTYTVPGEGGYSGFLSVREIPGGNVRELFLSVANASANATS